MASTSDPSFQRLGWRFIDTQARQIAAQLDGLGKAKDPESVHRARVASRRLRAALAMFAPCMPDKRARRWRKSLRRLARGLGPARDKDVQIAFLCEYLAGLDNKVHCRGVARLLAQVEQEREEAQPAVAAASQRFRNDGMLDEALTMAQTALVQLTSAPEHSPDVQRQTQQAIARKLADTIQYEDSLADAKAIARHHAMRIAVKRLRYTLEIAAPAYDGALDEDIVAVKKLQTMLGVIHDCDVWAEQLGGFRTAMRKRINRAYGAPGPYGAMRGGIDRLQRDFRKRRGRVFGELAAYWPQWRQRSLLPSLDEISATDTQASKGR